MRRSGIDLSSECSEVERACIKDAITTLSTGGNFLEIGTAAGGTLKEIIHTADHAGLDARFFVLDPFTYYPDQLQKVHRNLENSGINPDRVVFWQGTTGNHLPIATQKKMRFNFIFIDADHQAYPVMSDLRWMNLLLEGGVACFHDYCERFPGVMWSLNRFLKRNKDFSMILQAESLVVVKRNGRMIQSVTQADIAISLLAQIFFRVRHSITKRISRIM